MNLDTIEFDDVLISLTLKELAERLGGDTLVNMSNPPMLEINQEITITLRVAPEKFSKMWLGFAEKTEDAISIEKSLAALDEIDEILDHE